MKELQFTEQGFMPTGAPFVILFQGRSGSSHLCSLLDNHAQINCEMEIFPTVGRKGDGRKDFLDSPEKCMTRLFQCFSQTPIQPNADQRKIAHGFKVKPHQLETYSEVKDFLLKNKEAIKVIRLDRANTWQVAVSEQLKSRLLEKGYRANIRIDDQVSGDCFPVEIDLDRLKFYVGKILKWRDELDQLASEFPMRHHVDYDQLTKSPAATLLGIHQFLGVGKQNSIRSEFAKVAAKPYREIILNYDAVLTLIANSDVDGFLDID